MNKLYLRNIFIGISFIVILSSAIMSASGPGGGYTNAPGESNCTSCHSGSIVTSGNSNLNNLRLRSNFTGNGYIPDSTYTIEVTFKQTGISKFGFEVTCLDKNNDPAGTFTSNTARTSKTTASINGKTREYIQHSSTGTSNVGTDSTRWTFSWRAPSANIGKLTFYVVVMATNSSSNNAGDIVYGKTFPLSPSTLLPVAKVSTNDSVTCTGYTIQMNGSGTNSPTTWAWKFPGGSPATSAAQNPTVSYTLAGTKQAILTVRNSKGISEPDTMDIVVNGSPNAAIITGNSASICPGDSLLISANTGTNITYQWLHNNKTTRTIYVKDTGSYQVRVTSTQNGCARTSGAFRLNWYPRPALALSKTTPGDSVCGSYNETFTVTGSNIDSVLWYVNGVLSRRTKTLSTVFTGSGSINVQAVAKSVNGCRSDLSNTVRIVAVPKRYPSSFSSSKTTSTIDLGWKKNPGISSYSYALDGVNFSATGSDSSLQLSGLLPNTLYNITIRSAQPAPCQFSDTTISIRTNACSNLAYLVDFNNRACKGSSMTAVVRKLGGKKYSLSFNGQAYGQDTIYTFNAAASDTLRISILDSLSPTCPAITENIGFTVDTLFDKDTASGAASVASCSDTYRMDLPAGYTSYEYFRNNVSVGTNTSGSYTFTGLSSGDKLSGRGYINTCSRTYGPVSFTLNPLPQAGFTYVRNWKTYTFTADNATNASYTWKAGTDVLGNNAVLVKDMSVYNNSVISVSLLTSSQAGCKDSSVQTVTVPNMNGLESTAKGSFSIYPNPFGESMSVANADGGSYTLQIYDRQGRFMGEYHISEPDYTINTSVWSQGIYSIVIHDITGRTHRFSLIKL